MAKVQLVIDQVTGEKRPKDGLWKAPNHRYYSVPEVYWDAVNEKSKLEEERKREVLEKQRARHAELVKKEEARAAAAEQRRLKREEKENALAEEKRKQEANSKLRQESLEALLTAMDLSLIAPPPKTLVREMKKMYDGYGMEAFHKCVFDCLDSITWAMQNKEFRTEYGKVKYVLAILSDNLPDAYRDIEYKEKVIHLPEYRPENFEHVNSGGGRKQKFRDLTVL